ncbi:DinB family protein [Paenibacillus albiflavus]|uniref:DinB family protein n=1 Tax=Paenibacillus albiflavus TaxID=2545760 RepID=A0A4R4ER39_9BACL|nr:DinB family protein [Paenibacillus albiflavus]TCZ80878.1 DinB family protein [Paenibacillus albiflavus]
MTYLQLIQTYQDNLHSYSLEQLRFKPKQDVWSIGQMYSHIILTSLYYLDNVEICAAASKEQQLGKTEGGDKIFKLGGFPPIRIKLPEPENTPSNSESKEELIIGLDQVRQKMMEWESKINSINANYKAKHDGFGWLNAREWFDLISMHFTHHLRQKRELEQNLNLE